MPFDPSMMVHFRKRINLEMLAEINELIISKTDKFEEEETDKDDRDNDCSGSGKNKGKLLIDATCAPADIKYPTDLNLLNESREKAEKIIDTLHEKGRGKKPRTYRKKARKYFLRATKKKKLKEKEIRKALKQQLQFVNRDLKHIDEMIKSGSSLSKLNRRQYRDLLVIHEVYRQQKDMFERRERRIEHRIVRTLTIGFLTPFYFIRAGVMVSIPVIISAPLIFLALLAGKIVSKIFGLYPVIGIFKEDKKERRYYTLLMSTGLTFGTISALYGLTHGIVTRDQYSILVAVIIGSAVIPTLIANAFFLPGHLLKTPMVDEEIPQLENLKNGN